MISNVLDLHLAGIERLSSEHGAAEGPLDLHECIELQKRTDELTRNAGTLFGVGMLFLGVDALMSGFMTLIVYADAQPDAMTPRFLSLTAIAACGLCLFAEAALRWNMVSEDYWEKRRLWKHLASGKPIADFPLEPREE